MQASLPVATELGLLYFVTIKHVNMAMFPIPFHSIPSLCVKGFDKESLSSGKVRAYPGKSPSSRANNVGLLALFPLGVK